MSKTLFTLAFASAAMLALPACDMTETSTLDKPPGKYEHYNATTDANGTTRTTDNTTEVYEDEYGNKKAVVKSKKTTDPRGLFNKSTSKSEAVIQEQH